MTIQDISCFLEVAETLNYTRAGEKLYISQPVVSRHISMLEEELGFALFDRSVKRMVVLTPCGKMLYECLKRNREDFTDTLRDIRQLLDKTPIYFYIPEDTTIPYEICTAFNRIRLNFPSIDSTYRSASQSSFKEVLEEGGFLICHQNALPSSYPVRSFKLLPETEQYYLLCSSNHPAVKNLHSGERPDMKLFSESYMFLHRNTTAEYCKILVSCMEKVTGAEPAVLKLDTTDTIMAYLFSDIGYTVVHSWNSRLQSPGYFSCPIELSSPVVLAWRRNVHLTDTVSAYISGIRDLVSNQPKKI